MNEPPFQHLWEVADHFVLNILKPDSRATLRSMHLATYQLQRPGSVQETIKDLFIKFGISDEAKTALCAAFENYASLGNAAEQEREELDDVVRTVIEVQDPAVVASSSKPAKKKRGGTFDLANRGHVAKQKSALAQITLLKTLVLDESIPESDEEWTNGGRSWIRNARMVVACLDVCCAGNKELFVTKFKGQSVLILMSHWKCKCVAAGTSPEAVVE